MNLSDTWSVGKITSLSHKEKQDLKKALKEEVDRYEVIALKRYNDVNNKSIMISDEEHKIRQECMRRNAVNHMKQ